MRDDDVKPSAASPPTRATAASPSVSPSSSDSAVLRALDRRFNQLENNLLTWLSGNNHVLELVLKDLDGLAKAIYGLGPVFDGLSRDIAEARASVTAGLSSLRDSVNTIERKAFTREETQRQALTLAAAHFEQAVGSFDKMSLVMKEAAGNAKLAAIAAQATSNQAGLIGRQVNQFASDEITERHVKALVKRHIAPFIAKHAIPFIVSSAAAIGLSAWHLITQWMHLH